MEEGEWVTLTRQSLNLHPELWTQILKLRKTLVKIFINIFVDMNKESIK